MIGFKMDCVMDKAGSVQQFLSFHTPPPLPPEEERGGRVQAPVIGLSRTKKLVHVDKTWSASVYF